MPVGVFSCCIICWCIAWGEGEVQEEWLEEEEKEVVVERSKRRRRRKRSKKEEVGERVEEGLRRRYRSRCRRGRR